jgi:hypothetical protein
MVAAENAAARSAVSPPETSPTREQTLTKDQIAQALSSKDPSWFRQTADSGRGSAAYRKSQVEDEDRLDMSSLPAQLPGMSRASSIPAEDFQSPRSNTPSQLRFPSPMPLSASQKLDPPGGNDGDDAADRERYALGSPGLGRVSPTRPLSPTKGMGGFVQSAMMKRSDSVKRWSVSSPTGLARADSVASNRTGYDRTSTPQPNSRPVGMIRDGSTAQTSRPPSQYGVDEKKDETIATSKSDVADPPLETKRESISTKEDEEKVTPPTSPSKTMDPRRWSPTKASWLEAALNKPESPKPKPTTPSTQQPAWMVELNKAKAQKAANPVGDVGRSGSISHKHEVSIGGLMRSSPMGTAAKPPAAKPPAAAVSSNLYSPSNVSNRPGTSSSLRTSLSKGTESSAGKERSLSISSTASLGKTKPDTPPKPDFRANLKPRNDSSGSPKGGNQADELKNVVGNLRRTKTQNYVAPDDFRNNILKGKNALNTTGGPKKTERIDEFKDAILKKKDDFKKAQIEGRGITRGSGTTSEKSVPEGLARRAEMGMTSVPGRESVTDRPLDFARRDSQPDRSATVKRASADSTASAATKSPVSPVLQRETNSPARLQGRAAGGGLADRFNPALAGLLARGPPPMASGPGGSSGEASAGESSEPSTPGPQLHHMTKGRARGPKRKAPSAAATASTSSTTAEPQGLSKPATPRGEASPTFEPQPPKDDQPTLPPAEEVRSTYQAAPPSPKSLHAQVAAMAALKNKPAAIKPVEQKSEEPSSQPSSPKKLDMKRMSRFLDESSRPSSPKAESIKDKEPGTPRSPTKSADRQWPEAAPVSPKKAITNEILGSDPMAAWKNATAKFAGAASASSFGGLPVQNERPRSPLKSSVRPLPITPSSPGQNTPSPIPSPLRSPTKQTMEVSALLNDFFGTQRPKRAYNVDTAEILMNRPASDINIKSQGVKMFQFFGDGKKLPVPAHYERILFEREMYLCHHNFINTAGKKTSEVYFWVGDEVPRATTEDAEVFVQREAKTLGGKLVRLAQGKETPEFIQAFGGIAITRRGSSSKYDSLASSILCGRRYLGQSVFDEVDFSANSLCSGFAYLITRQGSCFLWKGKGIDGDELSCARVIGMDLTLTGELVEIDDGNEPANFWDMFEGGSRPHSADHWRLKPNYDKYCGRLFCSDASSPKQVSHLSSVSFHYL